MRGVCEVLTVEPPNNGMDMFGTQHFVERLSSFVSSTYTRIVLACPLFRGLSSFGVSSIGVSMAMCVTLVYGQRVVIKPKADDIYFV